ncbi:28S ribosomal protein S23, mitochondrial isoform X2 [Entelurus aequoreus]|uniref:28S ribosomal protein S23, mitochondrial isoform X2 n=1 Tax=Entelurus aequoreus TaxID=161455 RepID=UPI002B1E4408|nr:28S ribosomal protein S23, mitochondrial isoform X2 [Entelurus aequoreus]
MAGSRLERVGTVFSRVGDLMRSGVIKPAEKPIWYDVYQAFPPKREPLHVRSCTRFRNKKPDPVPEIFYAEDEVRAKFYDQYEVTSQPFNLFKSNFVSTSQRFVNKYEELKSQWDLDTSLLFEQTAKSLLAEAIILRRRSIPMLPLTGSTQTFKNRERDPVLGLNLADMLAELNVGDAEGKQDMLAELNVGDAEGKQDMLAEQYVGDAEGKQDMLAEQYVGDAEGKQDMLAEQYVGDAEGKQDMLAEQYVGDAEGKQDMLAEQYVGDAEGKQDMLAELYVGDAEGKQDMLAELNVGDAEGKQEHEEHTTKTS